MKTISQPTINAADSAAIFGAVPITATQYSVYTFKFYTGIGWIRTSE